MVNVIYSVVLWSYFVYWSAVCGEKVSDPRNITDDLLRHVESPCSNASWAYSNATGFCYMFVTGQHDWTKAQQQCKALKSALLRIEDKDENDFIRRNLMPFAYIEYWLDSKYNGTGYKWPNATIYSEAVWEAKQPQKKVNHCLMLKRTNVGLWVLSSDECSKNKYVYCRQMARRCPAVYEAPNLIPSTRKPNIELTVTYTCEKGYYMPNYTQRYEEWKNVQSKNSTNATEPLIKTNPSLKVTCTNKGTWDNTTDVVSPCEPVHCETIPEVEHAVHNLTKGKNYYYPQFVNYTCKHGYYFSDIAMLWKTGYCAADDLHWRQLDGTMRLRVKMPKKCDPVPCEPFKGPNNTNVYGRSNTFFNGIMAFRCREGTMYPDGSVWKFVKCGRNWINKLIGRWNETELPNCKPLTCPTPYRDNLTIPSNTNITHKNVIHYRCENGHEFPDSSLNLTTVCSDDAVWKPKVTGCKPTPKAIKVVGKRYKPVAVDAPEAVEIGSLAIIIVSIMLGIIVLLDLTSLVRDFKRMRNNIKHCMKRFTHPVQPTSKPIAAPLA